MRVLLSTIGSRGDVQPLVALALQLRVLGQVPDISKIPFTNELLARQAARYLKSGQDKDTRQAARNLPDKIEGLRPLAACPWSERCTSSGITAAHKRDATFRQKRANISLAK
jgi:hypothetical protein